MLSNHLEHRRKLMHWSNVFCISVASEFPRKTKRGGENVSIDQQGKKKAEKDRQ